MSTVVSSGSEQSEQSIDKRYLDDKSKMAWKQLLPFLTDVENDLKEIYAYVSSRDKTHTPLMQQSLRKKGMPFVSGQLSYFQELAANIIRECDQLRRLQGAFYTKPHRYKFFGAPTGNQAGQHQQAKEQAQQSARELIKALEQLVTQYPNYDASLKQFEYLGSDFPGHSGEGENDSVKLFLQKIRSKKTEEATSNDQQVVLSGSSNLSTSAPSSQVSSDSELGAAILFIRENMALQAYGVSDDVANELVEGTLAIEKTFFDEIGTANQESQNSSDQSQKRLYALWALRASILSLWEYMLEKEVAKAALFDGIVRKISACFDFVNDQILECNEKIRQRNSNIATTRSNAVSTTHWTDEIKAHDWREVLPQKKFEGGRLLPVDVSASGHLMSLKLSEGKEEYINLHGPYAISDLQRKLTEIRNSIPSFLGFFTGNAEQRRESKKLDIMIRYLQQRLTFHTEKSRLEPLRAIGAAIRDVQSKNYEISKSLFSSKPTTTTWDGFLNSPATVRQERKTFCDLVTQLQMLAVNVNQNVSLSTEVSVVTVGRQGGDKDYQGDLLIQLDKLPRKDQETKKAIQLIYEGLAKPAAGGKPLVQAYRILSKKTGAEVKTCCDLLPSVMSQSDLITAMAPLLADFARKHLSGEQQKITREYYDKSVSSIFATPDNFGQGEPDNTLILAQWVSLALTSLSSDSHSQTIEARKTFESKIKPVFDKIIIKGLQQYRDNITTAADNWSVLQWGENEKRIQKIVIDLSELDQASGGLGEEANQLLGGIRTAYFEKRKTWIDKQKACKASSTEQVKRGKEDPGVAAIDRKILEYDEKKQQELGLISQQQNEITQQAVSNAEREAGDITSLIQGQITDVESKIMEISEFIPEGNQASWMLLRSSSDFYRRGQLQFSSTGAFERILSPEGAHIPENEYPLNYVFQDIDLDGVRYALKEKKDVLKRRLCDFQKEQIEREKNLKLLMIRDRLSETGERLRSGLAAFQVDQKPISNSVTAIERLRANLVAYFKAKKEQAQICRGVKKPSQSFGMVVSQIRQSANELDTRYGTFVRELNKKIKAWCRFLTGQVASTISMATEDVEQQGNQAQQTVEVSGGHISLSEAIKSKERERSLVEQYTRDGQIAIGQLTSIRSGLDSLVQGLRVLGDQVGEQVSVKRTVEEVQTTIQAQLVSKERLYGLIQSRENGLQSAQANRALLKAQIDREYGEYKRRIEQATTEVKRVADATPQFRDEVKEGSIGDRIVYVAELKRKATEFNAALKPARDEYSKKDVFATDVTEQQIEAASYQDADKALLKSYCQERAALKRKLEDSETLLEGKGGEQKGVLESLTTEVTAFTTGADGIPAVLHKIDDVQSNEERAKFDFDEKIRKIQENPDEKKPLSVRLKACIEELALIHSDIGSEGQVETQLASLTTTQLTLGQLNGKVPSLESLAGGETITVHLAKLDNLQEQVKHLLESLKEFHNQSLLAAGRIQSLRESMEKRRQSLSDRQTTLTSLKERLESKISEHLKPYSKATIEPAVVSERPQESGSRESQSTGLTFGEKKQKVEQDVRQYLETDANITRKQAAFDSLQRTIGDEDMSDFDLKTTYQREQGAITELTAGNAILLSQIQQDGHDLKAKLTEQKDQIESSLQTIRTLKAQPVESVPAVAGLLGEKLKTELEIITREKEAIKSEQKKSEDLDKEKQALSGTLMGVWLQLHSAETEGNQVPKLGQADKFTDFENTFTVQRGSVEQGLSDIETQLSEISQSISGHQAELYSAERGKNEIITKIERCADKLKREDTTLLLLRDQVKELILASSKNEMSAFDEDYQLALRMRVVGKEVLTKLSRAKAVRQGTIDQVGQAFSLPASDEEVAKRYLKANADLEGRCSDLIQDSEKLTEKLLGVVRRLRDRIDAGKKIISLEQSELAKRTIREIPSEVISIRDQSLSQALKIKLEEQTSLKAMLMTEMDALSTLQAREERLKRVLLGEKKEGRSLRSDALDLAVTPDELSVFERQLANAQDSHATTSTGITNAISAVQARISTLQPLVTTVGDEITRIKQSIVESTRILSETTRESQEKVTRLDELSQQLQGLNTQDNPPELAKILGTGQLGEGTTREDLLLAAQVKVVSIGLEILKTIEDRKKQLRRKYDTADRDIGGEEGGEEVKKAGEERTRASQALEELDTKWQQISRLFNGGRNQYSQALNDIGEESEKALQVASENLGKVSVKRTEIQTKIAGVKETSSQAGFHFIVQSIQEQDNALRSLKTDAEEIKTLSKLELKETLAGHVRKISPQVVTVPPEVEAYQTALFGALRKVEELNSGVQQAEEYCQTEGRKITDWRESSLKQLIKLMQGELAECQRRYTDSTKTEKKICVALREEFSRGIAPLRDAFSWGKTIPAVLWVPVHNPTIRGSALQIKSFLLENREFSKKLATEETSLKALALPEEVKRIQVQLKESKERLDRELNGRETEVWPLLEALDDKEVGTKRDQCIATIKTEYGNLRSRTTAFLGFSKPKESPSKKSSRTSSTTSSSESIAELWGATKRSLQERISQYRTDSEGLLIISKELDALKSQEVLDQKEKDPNSLKSGTPPSSLLDEAAKKLQEIVDLMDKEEADELALTRAGETVTSREASTDRRIQLEAFDGTLRELYERLKKSEAELPKTLSSLSAAPLGVSIDQVVQLIQDKHQETLKRVVHTYRHDPAISELDGIVRDIPLKTASEQLLGVFKEFNETSIPKTRAEVEKASETARREFSRIEQDIKKATAEIASKEDEYKQAIPKKEEEITAREKKRSEDLESLEKLLAMQSDIPGTQVGIVTAMITKSTYFQEMNTAKEEAEKSYHEMETYVPAVKWPSLITLDMDSGRKPLDDIKTAIERSTAESRGLRDQIFPRMIQRILEDRVLGTLKRDGMLTVGQDIIRRSIENAFESRVKEAILTRFSEAFPSKRVSARPVLQEPISEEEKTGAIEAVQGVFKAEIVQYAVAINLLFGLMDSHKEQQKLEASCITSREAYTAYHRSASERVEASVKKEDRGLACTQIGILNGRVIKTGEGIQTISKNQFDKLKDALVRTLDQDENRCLRLLTEMQKLLAEGEKFQSIPKSPAKSESSVKSEKRRDSSVSSSSRHSSLGAIDETLPELQHLAECVQSMRTAQELVRGLKNKLKTGIQALEITQPPKADMLTEFNQKVTTAETTFKRVSGLAKIDLLKLKLRNLIPYQEWQTSLLQEKEIENLSRSLKEKIEQCQAVMRSLSSQESDIVKEAAKLDKEIMQIDSKASCAQLVPSWVTRFTYQEKLLKQHQARIQRTQDLTRKIESEKKAEPTTSIIDPDFGPALRRCVWKDLGVQYTLEQKNQAALGQLLGKLTPDAEEGISTAESPGFSGVPSFDFLIGQNEDDASTLLKLIEQAQQTERVVRDRSFGDQETTGLLEKCHEAWVRVNEALAKVPLPSDVRQGIAVKTLVSEMHDAVLKRLTDTAEVLRLVDGKVWDKLPSSTQSADTAKDFKTAKETIKPQLDQLFSETKDYEVKSKQANEDTKDLVDDLGKVLDELQRNEKSTVSALQGKLEAQLTWPDRVIRDENSGKYEALTSNEYERVKAEVDQLRRDKEKLIALRDRLLLDEVKRAFDQLKSIPPTEKEDAATLIQTLQKELTELTLSSGERVAGITDHSARLEKLSSKECRKIREDLAAVERQQKEMDAFYRTKEIEREGKKDIQGGGLAKELKDLLEGRQKQEKTALETRYTKLRSKFDQLDFTPESDQTSLDLISKLQLERQKLGELEGRLLSEEVQSALREFKAIPPNALSGLEKEKQAIGGLIETMEKLGQDNSIKGLNTRIDGLRRMMSEEYFNTRRQQQDIQKTLQEIEGDMKEFGTLQKELSSLETSEGQTGSITHKLERAIFTLLSECEENEKTYKQEIDKDIQERCGKPYQMLEAAEDSASQQQKAPPELTTVELIHQVRQKAGELEKFFCERATQAALKQCLSTKEGVMFKTYDDQKGANIVVVELAKRCREFGKEFSQSEKNISDSIASIQQFGNESASDSALHLLYLTKEEYWKLRDEQRKDKKERDVLEGLQRLRETAEERRRAWEAREKREKDDLMRRLEKLRPKKKQ